MPNGVICGGAVDGSNQLGEIVTCQAMTARPAGVGAAAIDGLAPNRAMAVKRQPIARRDCRCTENIIRHYSQFSLHSTRQRPDRKYSRSEFRSGCRALRERANRKLDEGGDLRRSRASG